MVHPREGRSCTARVPYPPCARDFAFPTIVNTWLKLKEEVSGWPEGCDTPEQRQAHIDAYYAREGSRLDPTRIAKNPSRRALAKMMLNLM